MGLTQKEKEEYKKGIELFESLGNYHHSLDESFPSINTSFVESSVNEESLLEKYGLKSTFRDLDDIQEFMKGKKFDFSGFTPLHDGIGVGSGVKILINFMGNKNVKVDKNNNFFGLGFDFYNQSGLLVVTTSNSSRKSCEIEEFMELPTSVEGDVDITVGDIANISDVNRIYDTYSQVALREMERLSPVAYSIFTNPSLYKKIILRIYDRETGTMRENTLFVTFNKETSSYMYGYNPFFILRAALDEWNVNGSKYNSLKDCYIYLLTFFITHEMMHIIHNNTVQKNGEYEENSDIEGSVGDHRVANVVQDSFINCNIAKMFKGFNGVKDSFDGYAPFPRLGVSNHMRMRSTHNKGFKYYNTSGDFYNEVLDLIFKSLRLDKSTFVRSGVNTGIDLSKFAGADFFVDVNVTPNFDRVRKFSSMLQKFFNDLIKLMTDAPVFETMSGVNFTDEEKASDYDILPEGTLVRKKNTNIVLSVTGYDKVDNKYNLDKMTEDGVEETKNLDGSITYKQKYKSSGSSMRLARSGIVPLTDDEIVWTDTPDDANSNDTKLSSDDIQNAKNEPNNYIELLLNYMSKYDLENTLYDIYNDLGESYGVDEVRDKIDKCQSKVVGKYVDNNECINILGKNAFDRLVKDTENIIKNSSNSGKQDNGLVGQEKKTRKLRVGDIVWVRSANSFGRIKAIRNGMFELEEVHEKPSIILDDSNNY